MRKKHFGGLLGKLIYRIFDTDSPMEKAYGKITEALVSKGLVMGNVSGTITTFKYPGLFFSSRKPATCISLLSMEIFREFGRTRVRFGVSLIKIKVFTSVFVFSLFF